MAGNSKFKNIQFRKGAQDKKRSKLFSKFAREITAAAKMGLPDPAMNPRLRGAIQAARAQNMPKDNIERAIKKSQEAGGANYEDMRYEGFGAGGVGVIVEALTEPQPHGKRGALDLLQVRRQSRRDRRRILHVRQARSHRVRRRQGDARGDARSRYRRRG